VIGLGRAKNVVYQFSDKIWQDDELILRESFTFSKGEIIEEVEKIGESIRSRASKV
jgi:hypothetical protein